MLAGPPAEGQQPERRAAEDAGPEEEAGGGGEEEASTGEGGSHRAAAAGQGQHGGEGQTDHCEWVAVSPKGLPTPTPSNLARFFPVAVAYPSTGALST